MKIAYLLLKGMIGGGIEKYTEELGSRLVKRGHEVVVYTTRHYGTRDGIYRGMKVITVPSIKSKVFEKLSASAIATIYSIFEKNIDLVHFHAFGPAMFCFLPKILGKKVVVQGHGIEWKRSRWNIIGKTFLKMTEVPSVKLPHRVTVVSKVQQNYLKNKYNIDSIYIPTGVNQPTILKPKIIREKYRLYGGDYILFAARLVREKGAHYLIEAYNNLNTDIKLVIAGDAQHELKYKKKLMNLTSNNKNIIFTGFVSGELLYELFSNAYFFVLPSEIEGLPIALLEAMSYGNCCLVSDIPENIEAIDKFGYTFKNKDVFDLKNKLEFLLKNVDAVNSIKEKAKEYVINNFSWDSIAEKFENLYKEVVNE